MSQEKGRGEREGDGLNGNIFLREISGFTWDLDRFVGPCS